MTPSPILAILVALGTILGGNALEGGHLDSLTQPTALLIVLGGTVGATWLASTDAEIKLMFKMMPRVVRPGTADPHKLLEVMLKVANIVRRDGILAVEAMLDEVPDEFLKRGLRLLVDGSSPDDVRKMLEMEIDLQEHHGNAASKVLETAGGFAPTIGILGAVLGLIHVMQNLDDPSKLGTGIAVAFVATIYGVGFANVLFIPLGNRLKKIVGADIEIKTMIVAGLEVIAAGANPRQVEETLVPFVSHGAKHDKKEAA